MGPRRLAGVVLGALLGALAGVACTQPPPLPGAACANAIRWSEAQAYLGQWATVRGVVVDSHRALEGEGQPTFLDLGRAYPDPTRFTIVVWDRDRGKFPTPPEEAYTSRVVCVTGLIDSAMGSPGTEVTSPEAIAVP